MNQRLPDSELATLLEELKRESKRMHLDPSVWTVEAVAERLKSKYGVQYHKGNLWRRMSNLGWQFQRSPVSHEKRVSKARK